MYRGGHCQSNGTQKFRVDNRSDSVTSQVVKKGGTTIGFRWGVNGSGIVRGGGYHYHATGFRDARRMYRATESSLGGIYIGFP